MYVNSSCSRLIIFNISKLAPLWRRFFGNVMLLKHIGACFMGRQILKCTQDFWNKKLVWKCRSYFENNFQGKITFVCESCYVKVVHLHHPAVAGHPGLHCHPSHLLPRHQAPHSPIHILDSFLHNITKLGCQIRTFKNWPNLAYPKSEYSKVFINCWQLYISQFII